MKSRLIIVVLGVSFLIWCGAALGKWANAESQATEQRMTSAMEVLQ